ncbi:MAG TPA: LURP-one-related family protein [Ornithinibacter sp.]|nr:LURP-one-related family protein [Ornithinibacter sp.]
MSVPASPAGFTRLVMKSKLGLGRDFQVLDPETEEQRYLVDGKVGPRPQADVLDANGTLLFSVKGQLLGIPKKMAIHDASGTEVAVLKAKAFSMVKDKMDMQMASGEPWHVEGKLIEKDYTVTSGGRDVVRISQKWLTVRDKYTIDVADGVEVGLALAVVWAIDRWVERD